VLALYGDGQLARPWWGDALLLAAVFGWMYAVARVSQKADGTPPVDEVPAAPGARAAPDSRGYLG